MKRSLTLAVVACFALVAPARAPADDLVVRPAIDIPVTLFAGLLAGGLALPQLSPSACRFCGVPAFDEAARDAIKLPSNGSMAFARHTSDVIDSALLPLGAVTLSAIGAAQDDSHRAFFEDMLVIAQSVASASVLVNAAKDGFARPRPAAGAAFMPGSRDRSFYSGHTSFAFSLATSTATISMIRDRPWTPWAWGVGLTLATGVGYLRMAGDAHWLSDVVVGAAVGGAVGFAVPWLFHRSTGPRHGGLDLRPAPGGVALVF